MKKTILILSIIILVLCLNKRDYTIPKDSIRFRVIANSNDYNDQEIKKKVVDNLKNNLIYTNKSTNIVETREYINKNLPLFTKTVENTLNSNKDFHINYGKNYFPEKTYNNEVYPEGEYESLVVTLGEGKGDNFWCVLFPPLCFLEGEESNSAKVEYTSFIKELINKYF